MVETDEDADQVLEDLGAGARLLRPDTMELGLVRDGLDAGALPDTLTPLVRPDTLGPGSLR